MAAIRLQNVSRHFGRIAAVDDVSLEIRDREVVTVVGPSGCGKSTLLRIIAGLEQATAGSVFLDGERVNDVPTRDRNIAMVFQSYALYPHMTCYENLALNLRLKKLPGEEIARRVQQTAKTLEIADLLEKRPKELSGGQRQRVAVGRALIRNPRVFLFDEPLSNLDALLRERVRHELKELFSHVPATVVYVTHDQIEALTLAHRVVVLDKGQVQQIGTPEELYRFPANRFVGTFIGSPSMNIFETRLAHGSFQLGSRTIDTGLDISGPVDLGLRPEAIRLGGDVAAEVSWIENLGLNALIGFRIGAIHLTALSAARPDGATVNISFEPGDLHVFDKETGENLSNPDRRGALRL
ncbi:MAG TPA: ABC transporter ATP-binding protein [Terriglobia bacterium]|nr:ABC transporter ATP-binding protein [Terriglobia bacterium]